MFERLQKKWNVSGFKLAIIILIFALGGSLTGYVGKRIMNALFPEKGILWIIIYLLLIALIWPLAVLLVSIPFGQFPFFKKYIGRIWKRLSGARYQVTGVHHEQTTDKSLLTTHHSPHTTHLAIFASGAGSNAQKIIDHFRNHASIKISLIICNKPQAGVLSIAQREHIPSILIDKEKFFRGDAYIPELKEKNIDFIVLAGFLWKIPSPLIKAYSGKIINIHPALLPNYGGKGMYGNRVHEAVIANGDKESGMTIHYVDEIYDHGRIIFQAKCSVLPDDNAHTLAKRIHELEHKHFPRVIEEILTK